MGSLPISPWDRLDLVYPKNPGGRGGGPAAIAQRLTLRIEQYELLARSLEERGPNDPTTRMLAGIIPQDFRRRMHRWSQQTPGDARSSPWGLILVSALGIVGPSMLLLFVGRDERLATLRWWPALAMSAPLLVPSVIAGAFGIRRLFLPRLDPHLALLEGRCAQCGLDVRPFPSALPAGLLDGIIVGPRACPGCNSPWPLLPPPADAMLWPDRPRA
jgi:hypothetical protein